MEPDVGIMDSVAFNHSHLTITTKIRYLPLLRSVKITR